MKIKILTEVRVEANLDRATSRVSDNEDYAKQLERAVKDIHDFIRDHRSMDWVFLNVVRRYEYHCEHCKYLWEVDSNGVPLCCDEAVKEHKGGVFKTLGLDMPDFPTIKVQP